MASYGNVHCRERQYQKTDPWQTQHKGWGEEEPVNKMEMEGEGT